uniref:Uncharacterized protein n=1 Tax=Setaria italica TaxID=4555 RepID=K4A4K1_SETIT
MFRNFGQILVEMEKSVPSGKAKREMEKLVTEQCAAMKNGLAVLGLQRADNAETFW